MGKSNNKRRNSKQVPIKINEELVIENEIPITSNIPVEYHDNVINKDNINDNKLELEKDIQEIMINENDIGLDSENIQNDADDKEVDDEDSDITDSAWRTVPGDLADNQVLEEEKVKPEYIRKNSLTSPLTSPIRNEFTFDYVTDTNANQFTIIDRSIDNKIDNKTDIEAERSIENMIDKEIQKTIDKSIDKEIIKSTKQQSIIFTFLSSIYQFIYLPIYQSIKQSLILIFIYTIDLFIHRIIPIIQIVSYYYIWLLFLPITLIYWIFQRYCRLVILSIIWLLNVLPGGHKILKALNGHVMKYTSNNHH